MGVVRPESFRRTWVAIFFFALLGLAVFLNVAAIFFIDEPPHSLTLRKAAQLTNECYDKGMRAVFLPNPDRIECRPSLDFQ